MRPRGAADRPDASRVDRGAVAVVVAVVATLIFALAAIVIDLGLAQDSRRQAQNAADSAALAAANYLSRVPNPAAPSPAELANARAIANTYVVNNGWQAGTRAVTVDVAARTVEVGLAPVQSARLFAGFVGGGTPTVSAGAQATWGGSSAAPCTLCVLSDASLQNGDIEVFGGGNALFAGSLTATSQGSITVAPNGVIGVAGTRPTQGTFSPAITSTSPFSDPYAGLQLPPAGADFTQAVQTPAVGNPCPPGNYADLTNCGSFTPGGLYVLTGNDVKLTGRQTLVADDVLLYFTCSTTIGGRTFPEACDAGGEAGATFGGAGNGTVTINGRRSGPYAGFAVIYDRNNTADLRYVGNGALRVNGAVYAASSTPDMRGNGSAAIHGALVVRSLGFSGNPSALTVRGFDVTPAPPATLRVNLTR